MAWRVRVAGLASLDLLPTSSSWTQNIAVAARLASCHCGVTSSSSSSMMTVPLYQARRWCSTAPVYASNLLTVQHKLEVKAPMGCPRSHDDLRRLTSFPKERIRNFSIIAHIDHGKTTLSDAILRRTGVLTADGAVGTYMDKLQVERERGITIKAQTCSMFVHYKGEDYLMNLIDTPGHVDFQYEVSRSLGASEGALLLVDASQGIEAQTMANFYLALENNLTIVPALTKLDTVMGDEPVEAVMQQLEDATGLLRSEVLLTSARQKLGVEAALEAIIDRVPPPSGKSSTHPGSVSASGTLTVSSGDVPLRALLFDCWTLKDAKGVEGIMCLVRVVDGEASSKTVASFLHSKKRYPVREVGIMHPEPCPVGCLTSGMVGYLFIVGIQRSDVMIGDTISSALHNIEPIPGFRTVKPVVFAGFFPDEGDQVSHLRESVDGLRVTDPSVTCTSLECPALGPGIQLGFLGMLHMKVFQERLFAEFSRKVLVTPPQVQYRYLDKEGKHHELTVFNWKWGHEGAASYEEPWIRAVLIMPIEHFGVINGEALQNFRAEQLDMKPVDGTRVSVRYRMPLAELARGFFDRVKSLSHGYASLDYDEVVYEPADLVKVEIVINKATISALSCICSRQDSQAVGRRIVSSLKENLTRSSVDLPIQAYVSQKCIARETIGAYKKDVTAKIHGGDLSRKQKKWADQKKGKERMGKRSFGTVALDQDVLAAAMGASMHNS
ncbi:GTP-binding protein, putative [Bodo saltans]|uniref:Translation factor GUF1 homolog, mitochondrial n=1 Tax=Bodo saltans TaxID=75058 RepID=B6DTD5_BODSA|nr:GTP-binding protein [Bodo saltans]CUG84409.1 GTP-binding protein, putative [Bodo saltans]|eukprot:CUG84409.1 GTP-binding protein, putative [Bodo saltans]